MMRDHDQQTRNILMSDNPNKLGPNKRGFF